MDHLPPKVALALGDCLQIKTLGSRCPEADVI